MQKVQCRNRDFIQVGLGQLVMALLLISPLQMFGQAELAWQQTFGGSDFEAAESVKQTDDGGYVVAGWTKSNDGDIGGDFRSDEDFWVIKLDDQGTYEWSNTFGGISQDKGYDIIQTSDQGFIVVGTANSDEGDVTRNYGASDVWVVKLDGNGNLQWERTYGGSNTDAARSIQKTIGGGFIIAGYTFSNDGLVGNNSGSADAWLLKLDGSGRLQWEQTYGGSDEDAAFAVAQTSKGGYVLTGYTLSFNGNSPGNFPNAWAVKVNSGGNLIWRQSLGGSNEDLAYDIEITASNNSIITGFTASTDGDVNNNYGDKDLWVLKLAGDGSLLWNKVYGSSAEDVGYAIQETGNGSYIVSGYASGKDGVPDQHFGQSDAWLLKLSASGSLRWQQILGGDDQDEFRSVQQTQDGNYIAAGLTQSENGDIDNQNGIQDVWITRVRCPSFPVNFSIDQKTENRFTFNTNVSDSKIENWNFGDTSTSTKPNPTHTYQDTGTYQVCLTAADPCYKETVCRNLQVNCLAIDTDFSYEVNGNQLIITDSFPNATNYTWQLGDGTTYESPNPTHTFDDPGIYSVCLEAGNDCTENSHCKDVNVSLTASKPGLSAKDMAIYPNPVSARLHLQIPESQHQGRYHILTAWGKVLSSGPVSPGSDQKTIHISQLAPEPGLYLLKLELGSKSFTKRFIVR